MPSPIFSSSEAARLAGEVETQLHEWHVLRPVRRDSDGVPILEPVDAATGPAVVDVPSRQREVIEVATARHPDSYWEEFQQAACVELRRPDHPLRQGMATGDYDTVEAVQLAARVVQEMGAEPAMLPALTVAATVVLLDSLLRYGVDGLCYTEDQ